MSNVRKNGMLSLDLLDSGLVAGGAPAMMKPLAPSSWTKQVAPVTRAPQTLCAKSAQLVVGAFRRAGIFVDVRRLMDPSFVEGLVVSVTRWPDASWASRVPVLQALQVHLKCLGA